MRKTTLLYFYCDRDQKEIDLLIEKDQTLYPIEIKKTAAPSPSSMKHFSVLQKFDKKIGTGAVICFRDEDMPLTREIFAIPIRYL